MKYISLNDIAHGRVAKAQRVSKVRHTVAMCMRDVPVPESPFLELTPLSFGKNLYIARLRAAPHRLIIVERVPPLRV